MELKKKHITGWSIKLEWSNGKTENWTDCDSYFDTPTTGINMTKPSTILFKNIVLVFPPAIFSVI